MSRSLPPWERGLKFGTIDEMGRENRSLPPWERGLKSRHAHTCVRWGKSLPPWERGLKYDVEREEMESEQVAPPVGAWIEIWYDR